MNILKALAYSNPMTAIPTLAFDKGGDILSGLGDFFTGGAGKQEQALKKGINQATQNVEQTYSGIRDLFNPYMGLGSTAADGVQRLLGPQAGFGGTAAGYMGAAGAGARPEMMGPGTFQGAAAFTPGQFNYQASPGLAAQTKAVTDAVQKSAAARGMLGSTNTTNQIARQVGDVVSQDYGNEFSRFLQGEGLKQGAQAQAFNQGLAGFQTNQGAQERFLDRSMDQYNRDRGFGYGQFRDELGDFLKSNQSEYDRMLDMLGLGMRGAGAKSDLETGRMDALNDLIAQRSNARAAAIKAKYEAPGKFLGGAGDFVGNIGKGASAIAGLFG